MKTLMALVCASVILGGAVSTTACDVDLIDIDATTFYLYSDPCIDVAEACWAPDVWPDKRHPRQDLTAPLASVHHSGAFPVVWRFDSGDLDTFDWDQVRARLEADYGVKVGEVLGCVVCGDILPPECYRAVVEVFPAYERRGYRISDGDAVAVVSVLTPRTGAALVYSDAQRVDYYGCRTAPPPRGAVGTCGSATSIPERGLSCRGTGGGMLKPHPRDTMVLVPPAAESSTWGALKALYVRE